MKILKILLTFLVICFSTTLTFANSNRHEARIRGKVTTKNGEIVEFASVYFKKTSFGGITNNKGYYNFNAPSGEYTLVASLMGYKTVEKHVVLKKGEEKFVNIVIEEDALELEEIVIKDKSAVQQLKESAYNALAIDAKKLHNTTADLSDALAKTPGVKIRETGGVGSDMRLMLDGFSGKHIKLFIDGVPQDGAGASFGLNNIPINFAERIEVYRGVVPVGFGTDALAGIINIVTKKNKRSWFVDASYTYGSFNTHKSYINFGQTFKNGLTYEINAFQNYSDNNYYIDTPVEVFNDDGTSYTNSNNIEHVKRFHDTYHSESVVGKVGFTDKKWADRLMIGFTYSQYYKDIQNGVVQTVVYGEKHRKGNSIMPSLEYRKRNLFVKGLDVTATANYNNNKTYNVDTSRYKYNWKGEKLEQTSQGEQTYQNTRSNNENWNATFTANYRLGKAHTFTFNHVLNSFHRSNTTNVGSGSSSTDAIAKETRKNVSGLSYNLKPSDNWNISVFGKLYNQFSAGPVAETSSLSNYIRDTRSVSSLGYGAAGTYFFLKRLQAKLSYERAYRLPTNEEMFGDEDLELGTFTLRPEKSDNFNLSLGYNQEFGKHSVFLEGGLIYRDAKDYIQRRIARQSGGKQYATYENHGRVLTKGFNISAQYNYLRIVSIGGNFSYIDTRDKVKTLEGGTNQQKITYDARMPNVPYMFAGSDVNFHWYNLLKKGNTLTLTYDNLYMHSFPLYSEILENSEYIVPTQFSHNLSISYSMENGKYNVSFECRNFTNENLYDNFSLQKAGRAFYIKLRVHFGGSHS